MIPRVTMREALADPALLGSILADESWSTWRVMLIACMGEPLDDDELAIFTRFTGRPASPAERVEEAWFIIGRRGGKDRAASVLATYLAGLCDHPALVAGERGTMLCIAPDQRQAMVQLAYTTAAFEASPMLSRLVAGNTADALTLVNGIVVEVRAAHYRRLRGMTAIGVVATETAFWPSDDGSTNPDTEILGAVRPALATTGGPLIAITSPYARRGEAFATWEAHHGAKGDPAILVAQGASRDFNPTLPQHVVDRAMARDPAAASAEFLGLWRSDVESFVSREAVQACVVRGVYERDRAPGVCHFGFVDPSGGSSDSYAAAVAHRDGDGNAVLDAVREVRPPFSPDGVTAEFAAFFKSYGITRISGDRYAGEWPREAFRGHGITYESSTSTKSEIYGELLPLLNSGRVDLLDDQRLVAQLCGLERRVARGGRSSIDHAPNGHDDRVNAAAGALVLAGAKRQRGIASGLDLNHPIWSTRPSWAALA